MKNLNSLRMSIFAFLAISFLFMGSTDLFAQPTVKSITRYQPTEKYNYNTDLIWKVTFSEPIDANTITDYDDFTLTTVAGYYYQYTYGYGQQSKDRTEWIIYAYCNPYYYDSEVRLDFTGQVSNDKGTTTSKGYTYTSGETFVYGVKPIPSVTSINIFSPSSQNIYPQNLSWYVYFNQDIDGKTFTTADLAVSKTGSATGTISTITAVNASVYKVDVTSVSGVGNIGINFTGTVSNIAGDKSTSTYTYGTVYVLQPQITLTSITRYIPAAQQLKGNTVTFRVLFSRSMNASSVNTTDFQIAADAGQLTGAITSVSGSGTTFYVTVSGITKDVTLRLNSNGSFTDSYNLTNSASFYAGETYMIDNTSPLILSASLESTNQNIRLAYPENTASVFFNTNEVINILSAKMNGKVVSSKGSGTTGGSAEYTYTKLDPQGLATFEFIIADNAGNQTTFSKTTDGSFVNFVIPIPQVVIIEQPHDVVACEGSTDKYLFVIAAPDFKGFNIAYRWWKDGRPITDWVQDFGQLSLDTLRYRMSGTYKAEMFVFDPLYDGGYGNGNGNGNGGLNGSFGYSYEEARVSSIVFSDDVNLYVLQKPSFLRDISSVTAAIGSGISLTFDAQIYGEHNMENPTYWTQIQWFRGTTAITDNQRFEGAQSSIFNIENVQATDYASDYRVRLIGECDTVWSNSFAISEQPYATITTQPTSTEGCVGDVVQISVEANATLLGTILTYQWSVDGVMITDEAGKFNGTNSPNLNVTLNPALAYNGTEKFTCHVWPVGFPSNGTVSTPVMITWKTAPTITTDLSAAYSVKEDEDIELMITADGANLTYTWTKDGVDLANNNDKLAITMAAMTNAGEYVVTVSNDCGEVTSATATLTVTQGPVVLTGVNDETGLGLSQNYPNPFADNSTMSFNPQTSGNATVVMTDLLGNVIANLYSGNVTAGTPTPIHINGMNLTSGTYFITLRMGDKVETRQISIVR